MDRSKLEEMARKKNMTPEALEKRMEKNKKIFKFVMLPSLIFLVAMIMMDGDDSSGTVELKDPLNIGREKVQALVGQKEETDKWKSWGIAQTQEGTDNSYWVAYLDSANISLVSNKETQIIEFADLGKNSAMNYLKEKKRKRKEKIKLQFYPWNGSHRKLTDFIKKHMHDSDSYEHVETSYWDRGDHLVVMTKYRGKNALGGIVQGMIKVKATIEGDIFEVIEQQ